MKAAPHHALTPNPPSPSPWLQGADLASAMMERLDHTRVRGLFATHLHRIIDDMHRGELKLPNSVAMSMGTEVEEVDAHGHERRRPTWRLEAGPSRASLVMEVRDTLSQLGL
jgi:DNA mismatch repair ATPase MutS